MTVLSSKALTFTSHVCISLSLCSDAGAAMTPWLQSFSITPCLCTLQWYHPYRTLALYWLNVFDFSTWALNWKDFISFPISKILNCHENVIFHMYRKFIMLKISTSGDGIVKKALVQTTGLGCCRVSRIKSYNLQEHFLRLSFVNATVNLVKCKRQRN